MERGTRNKDDFPGEQCQDGRVNIEDRSERRSPQTTLDPRKIAFGKTFAPNMFVCDYGNGRWQNARLEPVHDFSLHPAALVLHYAQAIFEGLKAFRQEDGSVALFRPEKNAARLNKSAERMCMPRFPEDLFLEAVSELARVEEEYVIAEPGSLYLRPTMIGTEVSIGVRSSNEFLFYILALPSGAYFPEAQSGLGAVEVLISKSVVRAAHGGTGAVKAAANYAVTLKAISEAKHKNCAQVLFLDAGNEQRVGEMGGMNIMFIEDGKLITPGLNDTILAGVIRDSVLELARDAGIETREQAYPIAELVTKLRTGKIEEAFACGTAATITAISNFQMEDGESFALTAPGRLTEQLYRKLTAVQYGRAEDTHGWRRQVVGAKSLA